MDREIAKPFYCFGLFLLLILESELNNKLLLEFLLLEKLYEVPLEVNSRDKYKLLIKVY